MIDVCLILEGTYPYVTGGVATWVHQLITAMRDIKFAIVHIAAHSDPTRKIKYDMPEHVISLKDVYLHDYQLLPDCERRPEKRDFEIIQRFYDRLEDFDEELFAEFLSLFRGQDACLDVSTVFSEPAVWRLLTHYYERHAPDVSFLDFFWTWRGTHLPIVQILKAELPPARIYHCLSTGYAGLLGAVAKVTHRAQFFLTEHGIYTYERMLEITQSTWIYEKEDPRFRAASELSYFKKWWLTMFRLMSHTAYRTADRIFTLYEGNRIREVLEGASREKITLIPNGIDVRGFGSIVRQRKPFPSVGLIGRVVSIKDIKTFIQSARLVLTKIPEARFYVIGPTDEEEEYYEECKTLVESLGLTDRIEFTGQVDVKDYYAFLKVVVLTSLSEAQPYIILEASLAGIPVVASDVGACREMLEGVTAEDRLIGKSGLVTGVSNPEETALAVVTLLKDEVLSARCVAAGKARVMRFYDQDDLLSRYLNVYERSL